MPPRQDALVIATVLTAVLLLVGLVATVAIGGGLLYARSQRRLRAGAPRTADAGPAGPGRQEQR